jgi:hypothetical protein
VASRITPLSPVSTALLPTQRQPEPWIRSFAQEVWSGRPDLNRRPPVPKLDYAVRRRPSGIDLRKDRASDEVQRPPPCAHIGTAVGTARRSSPRSPAGLAVTTGPTRSRGQCQPSGRPLATACRDAFPHRGLADLVDDYADGPQGRLRDLDRRGVAGIMAVGHRTDGSRTRIVPPVRGVTSALAGYSTSRTRRPSLQVKSRGTKRVSPG